MRNPTRPRVLGLALGLVAALVFAACDPPGNRNRTGIRGIDKFNTPGPEPVSVARVGTCTQFLPPNDGSMRPGLGWGGFDSSSADVYEALLSRVASFGTLVTATNGVPAGSGQEISNCIDQLDASRSDSRGDFAAAGHVDGGSGAINASRLNSKVRVTCPVLLDGIVLARSDGRDIKGTASGPALILCDSESPLVSCTSEGNGDTKFNEAIVPITRIAVNGSTLTSVAQPNTLFPALVTTCVESALGGDADALAALRPGGTAGARGISRVATRNQTP